MSQSIVIPASKSQNQVVASPTTSTTLHDRMTARRDSNVNTKVREAKVLHPHDNEYLKLLILENISQEAVKAFQAQGFHVDHHTKAMSEDELVEKIGQYHAIGIRSKTKITERVIKAASKVCPYLFRYLLCSCVPAAAGHWVLLHWHQPGRP